jgi:GNAT superfamily N-acetyltransferase
MRIGYLSDNVAVIPTLARWHYEEWGYLHPGSSVNTFATMLQSHLGRKRIPTTFVALSKGIIIGSASLVAHDMDTRMDLSPWLAHVFVTPVFRSRGIGSALVHRVIKEAEQLYVNTLYLFTPDREGFYVRLGWHTIERTEYQGHQVVIMAIDIFPPSIAA